MTDTSTDLTGRMVAAQEVAAPDREETVSEMLEKLKPRLTEALPRQLDVDRFVRVCMNQLQGPTQSAVRLRQSTRASLLGAIMLAGQLGLEPDVRGLSYLIPRWSKHAQSYEATFMIGYRGYIELYRRSGLGVSMQAHVVREGDEWEFEFGTNSHLRHVPLLDDAERGSMRAVYAVARYRDGGHDFTVLSPGDVQRRRQRSAARDDGPWQTDEEAMTCKTAVRALAPFLPQTPEIAVAQSIDERVHYDLGYGSPVPRDDEVPPGGGDAPPTPPGAEPPPEGEPPPPEGGPAPPPADDEAPFDPAAPVCEACRLVVPLGEDALLGDAGVEGEDGKLYHERCAP